MEQNRPKFRLRLNLFDVIILLAALAAGAVVLWLGRSTGAAPTDASAARPVVYTVMIAQVPQGNSAVLSPGDKLINTEENYALGTITDVRTSPCLIQALDQEAGKYVDVELAGYEDVYLTVESTCTQGQNALLLDGGYEIRVGQTANVRTHAFIGSGRVIEISRGAEG